MDNSTKMSEMASMEPKDVNSVKILICYLLYELKEPVDSEQLYEISVDSGIINYFFFQEAISELIKNDTILSSFDENNALTYSLTAKGKIFALEFKGYVGKSLRDRMMYSALQYFSRKKSNDNVSVEYLEQEHGCYVRFVCHGEKKDLIDMKIYAPNMSQAKLLGEKIMKNPNGFYERIISLALINESEQ